MKRSAEDPHPLPDCSEYKEVEVQGGFDNQQSIHLSGTPEMCWSQKLTFRIMSTLPYHVPLVQLMPEMVLFLLKSYPSIGPLDKRYLPKRSDSSLYSSLVALEDTHNMEFTDQEAASRDCGGSTWKHNILGFQHQEKQVFLV